MEGTWQHLGTFSDAVDCPKVDLRAGDPEEDMKFMGRKPECASFDCNVCGFGKEGAIPFCKVLGTSKQPVKWTRYEDLERPGKTTLTTNWLRGRASSATFERTSRSTAGASRKDQVADKLGSACERLRTATSSSRRTSSKSILTNPKPS